tara:strand:+ start:1612 stop:2259 length:648 start_codon:yes stop_codon:yes gene_type:complete
MSKSNKYGYSGVDIPTQAFQANVGKFDPAEINELVQEDKWTQYGQLELIQTINASGTSNIEFTSIDESTYNVHFLTLQLSCTGTAGSTTYYIQFYEDGIGWETGSVYQFAYQDGNVNGTFTETKSTSQTLLSASFFYDATTPTINGYQYFYNLGDSSKYSFQTMHSFTDDGGGDGFRLGSGVLPQTSTVTGIRLTANGSTTSTGTVSLYGIKEYS